MGLIYPHLDDRTRKLMAEELAADVAQKKVYYSPRLVPPLRQRWVDLLTEAIQTSDDDWLAAKARRERLLLDRELRHSSRGRPFSAQVPNNAEDMLAEGEFNRYYIRALCRRAEQDGIEAVEVFRAKAVADPRLASQMRIGMMICPKRLLEDLRRSVGIDTALGVPAGPNSGISVRIPMQTLEQVEQ